MRSEKPQRRSRGQDQVLALAKTVVIVAALVVAATGCSTRRASFTPTAIHSAPPRDADKVEVLLDRAPERSFSVVGTLEARSIENPASIEMLRRAAAEAGLDGLYWIDCDTPRSGRCRAKGFVYDRPKPNPVERTDSIALDDFNGPR